MLEKKEIRILRLLRATSKPPARRWHLPQTVPFKVANADPLSVVRTAATYTPQCRQKREKRGQGSSQFGYDSIRPFADFHADPQYGGDLYRADMACALHAPAADSANNKSGTRFFMPEIFRKKAIRRGNETMACLPKQSQAGSAFEHAHMYEFETEQRSVTYLNLLLPDQILTPPAKVRGQEPDPNLRRVSNSADLRQLRCERPREHSVNSASRPQFHPFVIGAYRISRESHREKLRRLG
jgi:hypothetical protein